MPRLSRSAQNIPQVLRSTLRYAALIEMEIENEQTN